MKVSNGKTIRRLGWRSMKAARTRNLIAVLAIALTTVLFTSLFTIAMSINDGFQQSNFRQVGGFSHGGFKYLTEEQCSELKDDPLIDQWGVRRFLGIPTDVPFNKSHVEVSWSDANYAHWSFCDPVEGSLPQEGTDQAATDTQVLALMGIGPNSPSPLTWTAMRPPRPLPCAAGGSGTGPSRPATCSFRRAGWTPSWTRWGWTPTTPPTA